MELFNRKAERKIVSSTRVRVLDARTTGTERFYWRAKIGGQWYERKAGPTQGNGQDHPGPEFSKARPNFRSIQTYMIKKENLIFFSNYYKGFYDIDRFYFFFFNIK